MASTDSGKAKVPSFSIAYGWSEGPWQSRKMRGALIAAGFSETKKTEEADIIIAHSLGCYLVPHSNRAKVVLLIGLPYWPGKAVFVSVVQNTAQNIRSSLGDGSAWWLNKLLHNCWYILTRPAASYHAFTKRKLAELPPASASRHILLIRNEADTFCRPDIREILGSETNYTYVFDVGGAHHEDCWLNPIPYVNLIRRSL